MKKMLVLKWYGLLCFLCVASCQEPERVLIYDGTNNTVEVVNSLRIQCLALNVVNTSAKEKENKEISVEFKMQKTDR